jgi:hypothetical protein
MSKSVPQNAAYQSVGTAADTLADKVTAFTTCQDRGRYRERQPGHGEDRT